MGSCLDHASLCQIFEILSSISTSLFREVFKPSLFIAMLPLQVESDVQLRTGFKRVYNKALAGNLVQMYKENVKVFTDSGKPFKHEQAANASTIRAWDDAIQTAAYGWKDADEYYAGSSSANHVPSIKVPTLCIQVQLSFHTPHLSTFQ